MHTAGTGISISNGTITNTSVDRTVTLTGAGATTVTGTYPNFTITSTDNNTTYRAGTGISLANNTITNTSLDRTVTLTGAGATTVTGTYPNFTITSTDNNTTYGAGTGINIVGTTINATNNGDITSVTAGAGLTGGGNAGALTITAAANSGVHVDATDDRIQLGGTLLQATTITQGNHQMTFNLSGTGNFIIQDGGDDIFHVDQNGDIIINSVGEANWLRVESDRNANMLVVDGTDDRVGIGTNAPTSTLHINGSVGYNIEDGNTNISDMENSHIIRISSNNTNSRNYTLPAPNTCRGREYLFINMSNVTCYVSRNYITMTGNANYITSHVILRLISDGIDWIKFN